MGPPWKLYFDSRFRNAGGSSSDFQATLAQSIEVPENIVDFLDSERVYDYPREEPQLVFSRIRLGQRHRVQDRAA